MISKKLITSYILAILSCLYSGTSFQITTTVGKLHGSTFSKGQCLLRIAGMLQSLLVDIKGSLEQTVQLHENLMVNLWQGIDALQRFIDLAKPIQTDPYVGACFTRLLASSNKIFSEEKTVKAYSEGMQINCKNLIEQSLQILFALQARNKSASKISLPNTIQTESRDFLEKYSRAAYFDPISRRSSNLEPSVLLSIFNFLGNAMNIYSKNLASLALPGFEEFSQLGISDMLLKQMYILNALYKFMGPNADQPSPVARAISQQLLAMQNLIPVVIDVAPEFHSPNQSLVRDQQLSQPASDGKLLKVILKQKPRRFFVKSVNAKNNSIVNLIIDLNEQEDFTRLNPLFDKQAHAVYTAIHRGIVELGSILFIFESIAHKKWPETLPSINEFKFEVNINYSILGRTPEDTQMNLNPNSDEDLHRNALLIHSHESKANVISSNQDIFAEVKKLKKIIEHLAECWNLKQPEDQIDKTLLKTVGDRIFPTLKTKFTFADLYRACPELPQSQKSVVVLICAPFYSSMTNLSPFLLSFPDEINRYIQKIGAIHDLLQALIRQEEIGTDKLHEHLS